MPVTVAVSPWVRKRGVSRRKIRFLRVMTFCVTWPTTVLRVTARAVARHVVSESGKAEGGLCFAGSVRH